MERDRWALQAAPPPKLQRIKRSVEGRRLRRPLDLESSMSIAGRSSSWEGNSNQTEGHSAAKPQPQTGGPEPTKQYQFHAEDAEERSSAAKPQPQISGIGVTVYRRRYP